MLVEVWTPYEANALRTIRETTLASIAWKWLGDKETHVEALCDYDYKYQFPKINDKKLVRKAWELMNEADMVVGHNAKSFDVKKLQARFLTYGFPPPAPFHVIDTKLMAKSIAAFDSNKLNEIGRQVGLGEKEETGGFPLWVKCQENDPQAWKKMKVYNRRDVDLLEEVYLHLRPWIKNHPTVAHGEACPKCGGKELHKRGIVAVGGSLYQSFRCKCGGYTRSGKALSTVTHRSV